MSEPAGRYGFALNPRLRVSLTHVGNEGEPVLAIDGMMRDARKLVEYAAREVRFEPESGTGGFPGLRAPAPLNYVNLLVRSLAPVVEKAFDLRDVALARAECNLSLVTTPEAELAPLQRIPHIDTVDPLQFAFLHYLCDERFGGTAFYRQRTTGFETVDDERQAAYEAARDRELAELPPGGSYIRGDTPQYEQTAAIDARFDRVVIYRSRLLHSGRIAADAVLSPNPRYGRLTANIFVNYGVDSTRKGMLACPALPLSS